MYIKKELPENIVSGKIMTRSRGNLQKSLFHHLVSGEVLDASAR